MIYCRYIGDFILYGNRPILKLEVAMKCNSLSGLSFMMIFLAITAAHASRTMGLDTATTKGQSLEIFLKPDGTLNLPAEGVQGSIDPSGYRLVSADGGPPRFEAAESSPEPLAPGDENWDSRFTPRGLSNRVRALAWDGTNLYAGGGFTVAAEVVTNYIAKWDGVSWSALGTGMNGGVYALAWDGTDLFAGGSFTVAGGVPANSIAKWDGTNWSALGTGMNIGGVVYSLAWDGANLYAGGSFTTAGGLTANRIARWNGATWSALGTGITTGTHVYALALNGTNLYAGGDFTAAGGITVNYIAKWDGNAWSELGTGMNTGSTVYSLAWGGTNLYAGGNFTSAGGVSANYVAKWNGSAWSALGTGITTGSYLFVYSLAWDGTNLYAGGNFTAAGGTPANAISKWNGSTWSALGTGMDGSVHEVRAIAKCGSNLYAGGEFAIAGGVVGNHIAKWDGAGWSAMPTSGMGLNGDVYALAWDGTNLYAGGDFWTAGEVIAYHIAKWDGSVWCPLGSGINNSVKALAWDGTNLYAGGGFTTAGGMPANDIAKWDGNAWSTLGVGMNERIYALAWDGTSLYAGGQFTTAGGVPANRIAKWDGNSWSQLGSGMDDVVAALAWDGTNLYAGGLFTTAGGEPANHVAKWDGNAWTGLGAGITTGCCVFTLAWDGVNLYAGGNFTAAGGVPSNYIAKWDGNNWSAFDTGMNGILRALAWDGTNLFAGGQFTIAGGVATNYIAKWDGNNWSAFGSGMDRWINTLAWYGTKLYAGGAFATAGGMVSTKIALWSLLCPSPPSVDVTPNGTTTVCVSENIALTATASSGTPPYSYQWTENASDIAGATNSTYTANKSGAGSYTYNCKVASAGCTTTGQDAASSTGTWIVTPLVDVTPNGTTAVCTGANIFFSATATGGTPPYTYQWVEDGSDISGATNSTCTANKATIGIYTYNCKVTDSSGNCINITDTSNSTGIWVATPTVDVTPDGTMPVCTGANIVLTAVASGGTAPYTYQWVEDGSDISGATNGTYTANKAAAGSFTYNCKVSSIGCATQVQDATASTGTWGAPPTVDIAPKGTTTLCAGTNIVFTASLTGGSAPYSYQWTESGTDILGATNSTYTANRASAGTYTYNCRVYSTGCATAGFASTEGIGNWIASPSSVDVMPEGAVTVCIETGIIFTAMGSGGTPPYSYQWVEDGSDISWATNSTYTAGKGSAGTHSYNCKVASSGCALEVQDATASTCTWASPPSPTISGASEGCLSVTLSTQVFSAYQWKLNGSNISGATSSSHSATSSGSYTVYVADSTGCAGTSSAYPVTIYQNPSPLISPPSQGACAGGSIFFTVAASGTTLGYQWRKDGTSLSEGGHYSGVTAATLLLSDVTASEAGSYDCIVTNGLCQETAAAAQMTVQACSTPMVNPEPPFTAGTSNQVGWSPVADAISYEVQASYDNFSSVYQTSGQIPITNHTFTGLASGTNYQYRAKAYFTLGSSGWSALANSTQDTESPMSTILSPASAGVVGCDTFTVSGTASDPTSGVSRVDLSWDSGASWHQAQGTTNWTYSWTLPADGSYTLLCRSLDTSGNLETEHGIQVQIRNLPAPATGVTASDVPYDGGKSILVQWTRSTDDGGGLNYISGYEIWRSDAPAGTYSQRAFVIAGKTFYEDDTTPGAVWYYKVRAKTGCNVSNNWCDSAVAGPVAATDEPPLPVTLRPPELTSGCQVRLYWIESPSPDVHLYNIYHDNGTGIINYDLIRGTTTDTSWDSIGLPQNTRFLFTVRAEDLSGQEDLSTTTVVSKCTSCNPTWPEAVITFPIPGRIIKGTRITVSADLVAGSPETTRDVLFQYRVKGQAVWQDITPQGNLHNPDSSFPYQIFWNATLTPRDYQLRAVATSSAGVSDPCPAFIEITIANATFESSGAQITEDNIDGDHVGTFEMYRLSGNLTSTAFERDGNMMRVLVPKGSLPSFIGDVTLREYDPAVFAGSGFKGSFKRQGAPLASIGDLNPANMYRSVTVGGGAGDFNSSLDLVIIFKDANRDGILDGTDIPVTQLDLFRHDAPSDTWILVNQNRNVDTSNNYLHVTAYQSGTYGVFSYPKPEPVKNLKVEKLGTTDANLTWDPVTKDDKGNTITVDHYNVYVGSGPSFYPDLVAQSNLLDQVPGTAMTHAGVLISTDPKYYLVTAVDSYGRESYPR